MSRGLKDLLQRVLYVETASEQAGGQGTTSRIGELDFSFLTFDELVSQRAVDPNTTFQVLSLRSFKEAVSEEWEKYARTVGLAAENTISRRLRKSDTCVHESDDTFLFLFDVPDDAVATEKLHDITEALMKRLIGDRFVGVHAQLTQVDAAEIMDAVGELDEAALDRAVEAATVVMLDTAADGSAHLVPLEPPEGGDKAAPKLVTDDPLDRATTLKRDGDGDTDDAQWTAQGRDKRERWTEIDPDRPNKLIKLGANDRPEGREEKWQTLKRVDDANAPMKLTANDRSSDAERRTAKTGKQGDLDWDTIEPLTVPTGSVAADFGETGNRRGTSGAVGVWESAPATASSMPQFDPGDADAGGEGQSTTDDRHHAEDAEWTEAAGESGTDQRWHTIDREGSEARLTEDAKGASEAAKSTKTAGRHKPDAEWEQLETKSGGPDGDHWPGHDGSVVEMGVGSPTSGNRDEAATEWQTPDVPGAAQPDPAWPSTTTRENDISARANQTETRSATAGHWAETRDRPISEAEWSRTTKARPDEGARWGGSTGERAGSSNDVASDPLPSKPNNDWGGPTETRQEEGGLIESDPIVPRPDFDWPMMIEVGTVVGHDLTHDHYDPGPPKAAPWQHLTWPPPDTAKRRRPKLPDSAVTAALPAGLVAGFWPVWNSTTRRVDTYLAAPMAAGEDGSSPRVMHLGRASPVAAKVAVDLAMLYATLDRIERNIDARQGWLMVVPLGFTTLMPPHFETTKLILEHFPSAARGRYLLLEIGGWPKAPPTAALGALRNVLPGLCRDVLLRIDGNGPPPQAIADLRACGLGLDLADFGRRRCPTLPRPGRGLRTFLWGLDDAQGVAQAADGHWLVSGAGLGPPLAVPQPWSGPEWRPMTDTDRAAGQRNAAGAAR